ncbi:MAG: DUF2486 family protein [Paraburkholderia sp.]|nr:MAG: DUF2486 family protein [Paraburkholderia sp.]
MTDSHDPNDPDSIPMLTDVIVPGRPPIARPGAAQGPTLPAQAPAPDDPSPLGDAPALGLSQSASPGASAPEAAADVRGAAFDARDVEFIAERLRGRLSSYLREDARRVVEARCRDAVEEHTNWLVRQVTREVVSALEAEVAGWVRDAVREELARHTSNR